MVKLSSNNGIALVTALLFTLISLGIVMAMLTIVTQGTKMSAAAKNYRNSIEAGYGAVDVISRDLIPTVFGGNFNSTYKANMSNAINMNFPLEACFNQKVNNSTSSTGWSDCTGWPDPTTSVATQLPDVTFNLKASNDPAGFNVYTKIVDTRCGGDNASGQPCSNSDTSGIDYLDAGGGVATSTGMVTPQHRPAYYRIEVQSQRAVNPTEKSQLSVLYAF